MTHQVRSAAALAFLMLVLSGCGGSGAAEPGTAPPLAAAPAGRVVPVGEQAEGAVADPVTHLVAVGVRNPAGIVLVDGRTGVVAARVPLPGNVRHLQLAAPGGPVLVPGEASGSLTTVGLPSGAVVSQVRIGRYAHDATAAGAGTVAVADELGEALVLVRDGRIVHRFTDVTQPGGLAAVGDLVAVVDVDEHTLSTYDTVDRARRARVAGGRGPTHLVANRHGRLLVADTRGDRLLTFTATPLRRVDSTPLPGTPYGIAYDPKRDRLWVTLTARNQVVGLDLSGPHPREVTRLPTVRQPNTVAVDPDTGRVFVASRTDGTLQLIDPPA